MIERFPCTEEISGSNTPYWCAKVPTGPFYNVPGNLFGNAAPSRITLGGAVEIMMRLARSSAIIVMSQIRLAHLRNTARWMTWLKTPMKDVTSNEMLRRTARKC